MADSVLKEVNCRPLKIARLQKACEESKPSWKKLMLGNVEDDEYLRQYLLLHYQFEKSEIWLHPLQNRKSIKAKVWKRGDEFRTFMFRLKPKDEENDSVEVEPPSPLPYEDFDKPPVAFLRADPKDGAVPGVPFVFDRSGAFIDRDSSNPFMYTVRRTRKTLSGV